MVLEYTAALSGFGQIDWFNDSKSLKSAPENATSLPGFLLMFSNFAAGTDVVVT